MRRAALQLFRPARRPCLRKLTRSRTSAFCLSTHGLAYRTVSSRSRASVATVLKSSMQLRSFTGALVAAAVASGAFYAYRGNATSGVASPFVDQTREASTKAEPTRRALVVGQGSLYTGTITGDGPLSKETDDYGRKVLEMLTPEQATQKLRKNEESWLVGRGQGVVRYDVVQIPSNDPIEDDHAEKIIEVPQNIAATENGAAASDWMFWGVFDGHSGWVTSAKLRQTLISFVARELNTTYKSATEDSSLRLPTPESIDKAIKTGFLRLDNEIVHESVAKVKKAQSKLAAAELLAPALSGSCALLSFYDSRSKLLRVACTGDSRAVLGRRGSNGKWTATPLSEDLTGGTPSEEARLRREHPGEPNVVRNGRILGGLEPSRAFGDAYYKWSLKTNEELKKSYFARSPSSLLKTPPYVTAEPVVTTTKMEPEKGDFVVMATDGLWEMLTNEEVVGLVGQWLDAQGGANGQNAQSQSWLKSWFSSQKTLPVEQKGGSGDTSGQRAPIRQQQWGTKTSLNERFVTEDKNAATHLVRNALGGNDQDQLSALLTLPSPFSRRYRDDLTVEVIFFGDSPNTGNVTLNKEASASVPEVKSKL
ncbi:phophatase 2C family protein-like protein [Aaosphaeria arxii CBS 175.79]|uniref:Phophatase 2C family protein-like protein n=1 Tax=Aaosphaeria arxii CBS 175.79 TaxID=1450172 RepID=A0A6A5Y7D6_9PLEO|nr:phophatase 2C family protein-like protein [Aaosphaeria arxii CBS 175.79]KAF2021472.1 phophatase 2C family protein-like protein [Aaosphaeria arxii CBS 175.79]